MEFENFRSGSRGLIGVRIELECGFVFVFFFMRLKKNDIVDCWFEWWG